MDGYVVRVHCALTLIDISSCSDFLPSELSDGHFILTKKKTQGTDVCCAGRLETTDIRGPDDGDQDSEVFSKNWVSEPDSN